MPEHPQKTVLGFDFGMKRIGVAIGQLVTKQAKPLVALRARDGIPDWSEIEKLLHEWEVGVLVVGIPLNLDDSEQQMTHLAKKFANRLESYYHLPTYRVDERLTTKAAREELFATGGYQALQKQSIDAMSAKIILEQWMAQQRDG